MSISNITFQRFTRGEEKAIEKVYLEYKNLMYFIIASYVPNKFDVEDILSDSFIKAVEHREEVKKPESLKSYLAQIAKNQALNFFKGGKNKTAIIASLDNDKEAFKEKAGKIIKYFNKST